MQLFGNILNNNPLIKLVERNTVAMSLRTKMLFLSGIVFIGFSVVVVLGSMLLRDVRIGGTAYVSIRNYQKALEKIAYLKSDFNQIRAEYLSLVEESSPEIRHQQLAAVAELNGQVDSSFAELLALIPKAHHKPLINAKDEWRTFADNMTGKIIPVIQEGDRQLALERLQSIQKYRYNGFVANLESLITVLNQLADKEEQSAAAMVRGRMLEVVSTGLLIFLFVLVLSLLVSLLIVRPLRKAAEFTCLVSEGDLTGSLQVTTRDEVGVLAVNLNEMVYGLNALVSKIGAAAHELTRVSRAVSVSSQQVSSETEQQVVSISHVSAAVENITASTGNILDDINQLSSSNFNSHSAVSEMAASISEVALYAETLMELASEVSASVGSISGSIGTLDRSIENLSAMARDTAESVMLMDGSVTEIQQKAALTSELAEQANREATVGQGAVNDAMASMDEIRRSSCLAREVVEELASGAEDIGAILSVIDEINARTALLALNARIISAQAGDSGKAFSVVASEFKLLSQSMAGSTGEIIVKIERVQEQTRRVVNAIRDTESVVVEGERLSRISGAALGKIVTVVQQTSSEMEAIARATSLQSSGSRAIGDAILTVTSTIEQVAMTSHSLKQESSQISSATERLNQMAAHVMNAIKENKVASRQIAVASETISAMIERIMKSCEGETVASNHILTAVEEIRSTMNNNLHAAKSAFHASDELLCQVEALSSAINGFKQRPVSQVERLPLHSKTTQAAISQGFQMSSSCGQN